MYPEAVTDPADHAVDGEFQYVVHGTHLDSLDYSLDRLLGAVDDPSYVSASFIGHRTEETDGDVTHIGKTTTFRHQKGLIIRPAEGQVVLAYPLDMQTPVSDESLHGHVSLYGDKIVESPERLLQATPEPMHNELVLRGDPDADVDGVFYKEGMDTTETYRTDAKEMADRIEARLGYPVPVVPVPDKVQDDVDRPGEEIWHELCERQDRIQPNV